MNQKTILRLIKQGEGLKLEFKPSLSDIDRITEIVCSFANLKGGTILVGISDTGKIKGLDIGKQTIERLTNSMVDNLDPKIYPEIKSFKVDKKNIISVKVSESSDKPHLAHGKAFIRVGKNTKPMSRSEYEKLLIEKHKEKLQFDKQICKRATSRDIDSGKVRWFLMKAKEERKFDVDPKISIKEALERLDLICNNNITSTAILLFGRNPTRFFPQAKIRCGRLKGTEGLDFIDMKVLDGTIPELREKAMQFIMEHVRHGVFFDANRRYDKWEYPLRALEEVLTNALAHRDYFSNADIQLSIYDDRIEVWNPGELPKPLTPKDLKRKHKSIPRNKLLAEKLFLIKYIEQWGKGTNRIIEEMKENKLPEPEFQNLSGGFEVALPGPGKSFEERIEKEKLHVLEINERQRKAVEYVRRIGKINRFIYCRNFKVGKSLAHREIQELVSKKILTPVGKGKATYYVLKT